MKLSDVMGAMLLSTYAEIALVIFLAVFVGVVLQLLRPANHPAFEHMRRLPLEDETTNPGTPRARHRGGRA